MTVPPELFPSVDGPAVDMWLKDGRTQVKVKEFPRPPNDRSTFDSYTAVIYGDFQDIEAGKGVAVTLFGPTRNVILRITIALGFDKDPDIVNAARMAAEAKVRETLGLSDAQLCALNIEEVTAGFRTPRYNLGLSFCPGSITNEQIRAVIQNKR